MFYCGHYNLRLSVSSVVGLHGVPVGVERDSWIGLGRLLGGEHDSTPQSGVEAPHLSTRSYPDMQRQSLRQIGARSPRRKSPGDLGTPC